MRLSWVSFWILGRMAHYTRPGEGAQRGGRLSHTRSFYNFPQHFFQVILHLIVLKAQHLDALAVKKSLPRCIMGCLVWLLMDCAINLHSKLPFHTICIQKVTPKRVLAPELQPGRAPGA